MRHGAPRAAGVLLITLGTLAAAPAFARQDAAPPPAVCAPALRGTVVTREGHRARGATIQLLVGGQKKVFITRRTDQLGRFRLPGGLVAAGSEWVLRITSPGGPPVEVTLKIDPTCVEPKIRLDAPGSSLRP